FYPTSPYSTPTLFSFPFFSQSSPPPRDPPSFPTRRSSDLGWPSCSTTGATAGTGRTSIRRAPTPPTARSPGAAATTRRRNRPPRSEEHTSELQSLTNLVCRLLLEKKNHY